MPNFETPVRGVYVLAPSGTRCIIAGCTSTVRAKTGEGGWVSFGGPATAPEGNLVWCPRCAKKFAVAWVDVTNYDEPLKVLKILTFIRPF